MGNSLGTNSFGKFWKVLETFGKFWKVLGLLSSPLDSLWGLPHIILKYYILI
jgi:hypothetical protein